MKIEQLSFFEIPKKNKLEELRSAMGYKNRVLKELNEYKLFI